MEFYSTKIQDPISNHYYSLHHQRMVWLVH